MQARILKQVVVIGGGFSGCCFAVNLVRRSAQAVAVTIIEPRSQLGRGLAYSTLDPDHRLNAPSFAHSLIPDDAWHFTRWCLSQRLADSDPEAIWPDGASYQRRADFARYLEQTVQQHALWPATGSTIRHLKSRAMQLRPLEENDRRRLEVQCEGGQIIAADLVICATGNHMPARPAYLRGAVAGHQSVIDNVFDGERLKAIGKDARVLVVGAGLTALDALSTLLRQGHCGPIEVVSRHGLRPKPQGPMPPALALAKTPEGLATLPGSIVMDRIMAAAPSFLADPPVPEKARAWIRALRHAIAEAERQEKSWHVPFDDLRDALWQLWPRLPIVERLKFLKRLRPWYDIHRYRTPPQNDEMVRRAEAEGRIKFHSARVLSVKPSKDDLIDVELREYAAPNSQVKAFDLLLNCSGLDSVAGLAANPLLTALVASQLIRPDPCALGIEVDLHCCALNGRGQAQPQLRFIGPPTFGTFGDPIGAMFIGAQIHRLLPDVLLLLEPKSKVS